MIELKVARKLGTFELDVDMRLPGKGLTVLFGKSGSGKTSVINMLAGLSDPDSGHIVINGRTVFDSQRRLKVPAYERRVGYVFQEARLFPHFSVKRNLRYGYRAGGQITFDEVTEFLGIGHLMDRQPHHLSGGEKQRVAIGRALLTNPHLLLMDEPLSALDEARKSEIIPFIERIRDVFFTPIVYVTHSSVELARLATTVVLMQEGRAEVFANKQTLLDRLQGDRDPVDFRMKEARA